MSPCKTRFKDYLLKTCPELLIFSSKEAPPPVISISVNGTSIYSAAQARKLDVILSLKPYLSTLPMTFPKSVPSFSEIDIHSAHVSLSALEPLKANPKPPFPKTTAEPSKVVSPFLLLPVS